MGQRRGEKKKHIGQGGCSSAKRAERAHPQLVHWWVLIHSTHEEHHFISMALKLIKHLGMICVATLALGSRPRQGLARVQAKNEAWESHFMLLRG